MGMKDLEMSTTGLTCVEYESFHVLRHLFSYTTLMLCTRNVMLLKAL
jgi:hypothetical protein